MNGSGIGILYLTGGEQRSLRRLRAGSGHWYKYHKAIVVAVDPSTGALERRFEYVSPPDVRAAEDPAILFKQGTIEGHRLTVCTQTEILVLRVPGFERVGTISRSDFHDLHHVQPTPAGTLLVVNSGLESVMELDAQGNLLREWSAKGDGQPPARRDGVDHRRLASMKPYQCHANHVFSLGGEIWVTRFLKGDAICLTRPGRIEVGGGAHDGVVQGDRIYFTTVEGRIVVVDRDTLRVVDSLDLTAFEEGRTLPGWCRGLWIDGSRAWVGFSRLRPTRFREYTTWVGRRLRRIRPAHIACYDLLERRRVARIEVEAAGMNAVFSILPAPPDDPLVGK